MKLRNILLMSGVLVVLSSCFKDDTTDATGMISEITIHENSIKELYDIDKNETLTVSPVVTQTEEGKPLSYTWEIDQKVYSHEKELVFVGNELGTFSCRLIVENEDGKAFFPFKLNVNSPYEEGITVISRDADGKSMISFMMKQRVAGVEDHFDEGDCFALNNPDYTFASNVSDVLQCNNSLLVACQGDEGTGEPGTIYYLNDKTLVVENILTVPEYSEFRPFRMLVPSNTTAGSTYPILCENGRIYEFSSTEGAVGQSAKFKSEYYLCSSIYDSGAISYNNVYVWDKNLNGLCMLYNCYGPYLCSTTNLVSVPANTEEVLNEKNYFKGYEPVFMFLPRAVGGASLYGDRFVMITKKGTMYQKTIFAYGLWYTNEETGKTELGDYGGMTLAGFSTGLTERTPYVATQLYNYLLYGEGNKVMRWIYTQSQLLNNVKDYAEVGSANAVITAMELSLDHSETYVAFYEPGEEGLNGHVWVLDTENGTVLRKYDNVCYRPVKIIYKQK